MTPPQKPPAVERELPPMGMVYVPLLECRVAVRPEHDQLQQYMAELSGAQLAALGLQRLALPESHAGEVSHSIREGTEPIGKLPPGERIRNLMAAIADHLEQVSDEETIEDAEAAGIDVAAEAARIRRVMLDAACRGTGRSQGAKEEKNVEAPKTTAQETTAPSDVDTMALMAAIRASVVPPHETGRSQEAKEGEEDFGIVPKRGRTVDPLPERGGGPEKHLSPAEAPEEPALSPTPQPREAVLGGNAGIIDHLRARIVELEAQLAEVTRKLEVEQAWNRIFKENDGRLRASLDAARALALRWWHDGDEVDPLYGRQLADVLGLALAPTADKPAGEGQQGKEET